MRTRKTRYAAVRWAVIAAGLGFAASYTGRPSGSAQAATMQLGQFNAPSVPPPAAGEHGAGKQGGGGNNFKESALFVDGKAKGILSYSEIPPALVPFAIPEIDGDEVVARYYRLADYIEATGTDVSRISEIHVYGSHDRVAIITGEELRTPAVRDKLVFDFTQQTAGKPRAKWAQTHALRHRPMVDVILAVSVYIDKTPPALVQGELLVDGQPVDGIPYVDDGIPKGTRAYVDGKLEGWVRRKSLPDKLIAPGATRSHAKFSMDAFVTWLGGDTHGAKAVDFYDGDVLLARVDGKTWQQHKNDYVFELTSRAHGQVTEFFPGDKSSKISSVKVYVHSTPPNRQPEPEALEQQAGGSAENQNGGGNGDGTGGNNGVTQDQASARGVNNGSNDEEF
jgi:hypothetical protein